VLRQNLERYLSINDDLHAALNKYEALVAGNQATGVESTEKTQKKAEDVDLLDPFGLNEDLKDNQESNEDDPFADFVRARTGSKKDSEESKQPVPSEKASVQKFEAKVAPKAPQQDEEDDPFASFVQQRATKVLSSSNQEVDKEVKPAAPAKDLIDLWDDGTSRSNGFYGARSGAVLTNVVRGRCPRVDPSSCAAAAISNAGPLVKRGLAEPAASGPCCFFPGACA
jgi:hypothetical protein